MMPKSKEGSGAPTIGGGGGGGSGSGDSRKPNPFKDLPAQTKHILKNKLMEFLPPKDIRALAATDKDNRAAFGLFAEPFGAHLAVLEGAPGRLQLFIKHHPEALFEQLYVRDCAGQAFYKVSPFQLILFLADDRMLEDIMSMETLRTLPEVLEAKRIEQAQELVGGGADIVTIDFDPTTRPFEKILKTTQAFDIWGDASGAPHADFPLLENTDGVVCYRHPETPEMQWYYANQASKKLHPIELQKTDATSPKEERALHDFIESCQAMEANSARRSSIEEHRLINTILRQIGSPHQLKAQKGIEYTSVEGVGYRDTRFPFNDYYNKARQCFRFYAARNGGAANKAWLELGNEQKKLVWRLQFLCQENLPFYPLPENFLTDRKPNKRELKLYGGAPIFSRASGFHSGLGSDFTIYKGGHAAGWGTPAGREPPWGAGGGRASGLDLIALAGLSEDAKRNIVRLLSISPESPRPEAGGCSIQ